MKKQIVLSYVLQAAAFVAYAACQFNVHDAMKKDMPMMVAANVGLAIIICMIFFKVGHLRKKMRKGIK